MAYDDELLEDTGTIPMDDDEFDDEPSGIDETDEIPRYTPEEYLAYIKAPTYILNGCESESEYHAKICGLVKDFYEESKEEFREEKEIWEICYLRLRSVQKACLRASAMNEEAISAAQIPIMKNAMLDEIAALYSGQYVPVFKALSEEGQQMAGLANKYLGVELKLNSWDELKFRLGVDGFVAGLWVVKLYTSDEEPGPFGEKERIRIDRIDPMNVYPDPKAPAWDWALMDYFIVTDSVDIGVCRNRFPMMAKKINKSLATPDKENRDRFSASQAFTLSDSRREWHSQMPERQRIQLKECWLHDERRRFRAYEEDYIDDDGKTKTRVKVDKLGFVEGDWEREFPAGRLVVTADDRLVLQDMANPYWHDGLPYEICTMSPDMGKLLAAGEAAPVLGIERKVNDTEVRVHSYMQSELERPMIADWGALPTNAQWFSLDNQSRRVLVVQKGYNIIRPQPVETPQFIIPYLARLQVYLNQTMGQSALMRGDVPEGAQLSAEAMQGAQGQAQGRQNMQAVFIGSTQRRIGKKMLWLMRETYKPSLYIPGKDGQDGTWDGPLNAVVTMPDGSKQKVYWNEKALGNDTWVDVDIAANQPGGQQQILNQALALKREQVVDRPYVLQSSGIEGWEGIDDRMSDKKTDDIFVTAAGHAAGVNIKSELAKDAGPTKKVK